MKTSIVLCLMLCAVNAVAEKIEVLPNFGPYNVGDGGEYTVKPDFAVEGYVSGKTSDLVQDGTFQTFCVEQIEKIYAGRTYEVDFNPTTSVATGKVLNLAAAWLYHQFALGTLPNYDYSPAASRRADAAALQKDLWHLMGWGGSPGDFATQAKAAVGLNWNNPNDTYPVAILNVWETGQPRQDVLVLVPGFTPGGGEGVPDGGLTLALLGMGLASLGAIARKVRRSV